MKRKKWLAFLLAAVMCIGAVPYTASTVQAASISAGTAELTVNQSKVAFAGHEWWVIGDGTSGVYPQSGHITLFGVTNDFGKPAFRTGNNDAFENSTQYNEDSRYYANNPEDMEAWTTPNEYAGSTLQQKMEEIAESIPDKEQKVISARSFTGGGTYSNPSGDGIAGQGISNQKVWALSKAEFEAIGNSAVYSYDSNCWLRSPYVANGRSVVLGGTSGATFLGGFVYNTNSPARPALSLNLSNVFFTSDASTSGKPAAVGSLADAEAPAGTVKFTMKDSSQQLTVNATAAQSTQTGETLSFSYSGATVGTNQYVSCVLTDDNGTVKYYGKLADSSGSASGDLAIPLTGVADGTYTLQIFSEEANDDLYTDFCSEPVAMKVAVSGGSGTVSEFGGTLLHEHEWGDPVWNWSDDGKSATVTFTCQKDNSHIEMLKADITSKVKTPASCTKAGVTTYTAKATFNGQEYTSTKDAADIAPLGHNLRKIKAKVPTASEAGNIEYWYCPQCGKYFADEALTKEITKEQTVLAATGTTQTGDDSNLILWFLLMLTAGAVLTGTVIYNQKKKYSR